MQWDQQAFVIDSTIDLAQQRVPDGSGGMLAAMVLWHRLGHSRTNGLWRRVLSRRTPR